MTELKQTIERIVAGVFVGLADGLAASIREHVLKRGGFNIEAQTIGQQMANDYYRAEFMPTQNQKDDFNAEPMEAPIN